MDLISMIETNATELPRLMACNGSHIMGGLLPPMNNDTTLRDEGNAAHYMAQAVFNGQFQLEELVDRKAPNGVYMTVEMASHVEEYFQSIALSHGEMEIETSFSGNGWIINARADHISYYQNILCIDDFKYGWSIVEPEMNWTLIAHAIGYCIRNQIQPHEIYLIIHQPRPFHPDGKHRSWKLDYQTLLDLYKQIDATLSNLSDELRTGPHCYKCPAIANCPAARKAELNAIDAIDVAFSDEISNELLSFELDTLKRAADVLKNRLQAFEELAKFRLKKGEVVENYAIEQGLGHTTWNDDITPELLETMTGKVLSEKKLVTPKEAIRRGVDETFIDSITTRPKTGLRLTRVTADQKAKRTFG